MPVTRQQALRVAAPVVWGLVSTAVSVSDVVSPTATIILLALTVPVGLAAWYWPQLWLRLRSIRRLRVRWPITLSPIPRLKVSRKELAERHIRYHTEPIRLVDVVAVAGDNGVLQDFRFEHCILEGPGIINLEGPAPKPETTDSGWRGSSSPTHCRVEGSPDTTLYQVTRDDKPRVGVIHLSGYGFEAVTFRGLGFAGTPEHLESLKSRLIFSEDSSDA